MTYVVRPAEPTDLPLLAPIEAAGDRLLIELFGPELFTDVTPGEQRAADPGYLLVAGRPAVGFAQVLEQDGTAHLQQLVVDPSLHRQGIGTALVESCCAEAARRGHAELTLTTFRDVAFNAPYYARIGFEVVEQPVGVLAQHLEQERAYDALSPRVGMVRSLA
jgi:ribosomal protein S18 acetylase RimI-like enzyme